MEAAYERGWDRIVARNGVAVTLRRGSNLETTDVPAVLGNQLLKVTDAEGIPQTIRTDKDFLIRRLEYKFATVPVEPIRGDKIVETIDGEECVYHVLPYGDEPVYRWADEFKKVYRIHTKLKAVA